MDSAIEYESKIKSKICAQHVYSYERLMYTKNESKIEINCDRDFHFTPVLNHAISSKHAPYLISPM